MDITAGIPVESECLSAGALIGHVRALADGIGPRPPGHAEEEEARAYIRSVLNGEGFDEIEEMPFPAWDTWGYSFVVPVALALASNVLGFVRLGTNRLDVPESTAQPPKCLADSIPNLLKNLRRQALGGRAGKLLGGLATLTGTYQLWQLSRVRRQPLALLFPKRPSANLVVRIPSAGERRHRVVLVGHTDTNKHRASFSAEQKSQIIPKMTLGMGAMAANGLAQLTQAAGANGWARGFQVASLLGLAGSLALLLKDEQGGYIDGANDNASAVACLLGLGAHLKRQPLQHTEVWLAFTGAEEVGCLGMHHLLDVYVERLADAWFIDFEMVGVEQIAYVTRHSGGSYLLSYAPDEESLALAWETAQQHPELNVSGQEMVIFEEVGALRGRGYRGICLVGVGEDGWLANWHRYDDNARNIEPAGLERAARFALAMMQTLDAR